MLFAARTIIKPTALLFINTSIIYSRDAIGELWMSSVRAGYSRSSALVYESLGGLVETLCQFRGWESPSGADNMKNRVLLDR